METLIEIVNVSKKFRNITALNEVSYNVKKSKIIGLLGTNGSGKTTLLKVINDLLIPDSGEINFVGVDDFVEKKNFIAYIAEKPYLYQWISVKKIIETYDELFDNFDKMKSVELIRKFNIDPDTKFSNLSKGNKERIQLILVLCLNAKVKCLDEPMSGVDPATRDEITKLIVSNHNKETTYIISTHQVGSLESVLDEVVFIKDGKIVEITTPTKIHDDYKISVEEYFRRYYNEYWSCDTKCLFISRYSI